MAMCRMVCVLLWMCGCVVACGDGELATTGTPPPAAASGKAQDLSGATLGTPPQSVDSEKPQYAFHRLRARLVPAVLQVYYNPQHAPVQWDTASMMNLLQRTANKWSDVCDVKIQIMGTTSIKPIMQKQSSVDVDGVHVVGWLTFPSDLANFSGNVSWWYRINPDGLPAIVDTDMGLNVSRVSRLIGDKANLNLGGLLTHEWGHMLGINHSDAAQSVMFANPYNSYLFQNTLRGDDAAACADLYGASPQAQAMRVFNWAEQALPDLLQPVGASSIVADGFATREYSQTGVALQVRSSRLYYRPGQHEDWVDLGLVDDWFPLAQQQGF